MINKLVYIKQLLYEENVDILFLQETELQLETDISLLCISGYSIELALSANVTRLVAYIKNTIKYSRTLEAINTNLLMLTIEGQYSIKQVCGIYRPFKLISNLTHLAEFSCQLKSITNFIDDAKKFVLMGDFNLDYQKVATQNYQHRRIYDELLEAAYAFDLDQIVNEVTWSRIYNNQIRSSTLDHVYVGDITLVGDITVEKQPISDHSAVILKTTGRDMLPTKRKYSYTCWKGYCKEKLVSEVQKYNWEQLKSASPQVIADTMDMNMGKIRDKLLQMKEVTKTDRQRDMPNHIIQMKNKLRNMYKRAKHTLNSELLKRSRKFEKNLRKEINNHRYNKVRIEAQLGPNNLWKAVRIATDKQESVLPDITNDGVNFVRSDEEKAAMFANHFDTKVKDIIDLNEPKINVTLGKRKNFGTYEDDWVNENLVKQVLDNLKPKRCQGYDRIPLVFYTDAKCQLLGIITTLMSKVVSTGIVPEQWKVAKVIPLYKKGKKNEVDNYRPISNLCSITKIFERLILARVKMIEKKESRSNRSSPIWFQRR